ncbi:unnamed protein product, partial [Meganyctiphanes norvegica]
MLNDVYICVCGSEHEKVMKMPASCLNAEQISTLSDEELRQALEKLGENVGPITPSLRGLFERRLYRKYNIDQESSHSKSPNQEEKGGDAEESSYSAPEQEPTVYFGIHPPDNVDISTDEDFKHVYTDKCDLLAGMKKYKGSRFKAFRKFEDALEFSKSGPPQPSVPSTPKE